MLSRFDFDKALKPYGHRLNSAVALTFLQDNWVNIVGGRVVKDTYPLSLIDNRLTLLVESSTALAFYRHKAKELVDEVNSYSAGSFVVVEVLFRVGRIPPARYNKQAQPLRQKQRYYIDDDLVGLERIKVIIEYKKMQKQQANR